MLLAATPTMAQDCRAIRRACVASCLGGSGAVGDLNPVTRVLPERVKACITRCSISPCGETPLAARLCDATAQRVCNNGFQGCNDACNRSAAATAAQIQTQATCSASCCRYSSMPDATPMRHKLHHRHQLPVGQVINAGGARNETAERHGFCRNRGGSVDRETQLSQPEVRLVAKKRIVSLSRLGVLSSFSFLAPIEHPWPNRQKKLKKLSKTLNSTALIVALFRRSMNCRTSRQQSSVIEC